MNPWLEQYRRLNRAVVVDRPDSTAVVSPSDNTPSAASIDTDVPQELGVVRGFGDGQQELWEERAAVLEFEAGLSRELAEAQASVLCRQAVSWPEPAGLHDPLEVGSRCPVCARHLYVMREGRLWCARCLRKNRP